MDIIGIWQLILIFVFFIMPPLLAVIFNRRRKRRLARVAFLMWTLGYVFALFAVNFIYQFGSTEGNSKGTVALSTFATIIIAVANVFQILALCRRLRDAGKSSWLALLLFVPLINIVLFLYCFFAKGVSVAGNEEGGDADSLPREVADEIEGSKAMKDADRKAHWWRKHVGTPADHAGFFGLMAAFWGAIIIVIVFGEPSSMPMGVQVVLVLVFFGILVIFLVYGISWIYFWHGEALLKRLGVIGFRFVTSRRLFDSWAAGRQRKEMDLYLTVLSAMPGSELGMLLASATDLKNEMVRNGVADVSAPYILTEKMPLITFEFSKRVIRLQKKRRFEDAAALMVWVHTLRAASRPELRGLGRNMWGELERGFPFVLSAAEGVYDLMGVQFNVDGFDEFPIGLEPTIPV